MENYTFDIRGSLIPPEKIEIDISAFEDIFVNSFDINSSRYQIFENYKCFVSDFQKEVTPNFVHWINGSFTSNKDNPNDIDFVTLINYETFFEKENLINAKFRLKGAKTFYEVDAYTLIIYSENHKKHFFTKSDSSYWYNWFSKTKKNARKQSFNKGFLELKF
jgi:hypothetical protein